MRLTIDMVATGKNITRLRKESGLSVRDLAEIFGFTTHAGRVQWQHGTSIQTIGQSGCTGGSILEIRNDEIVVTSQDDILSA